MKKKNHPRFTRQLLIVLCLSALSLFSATSGYAQLPDASVGGQQLSLKTNVAAWALAITNIEVEYQWHPRWSACLPMAYSAWNYGKSTCKFRTSSFMPGIRRWIELSTEKRNVRLWAGVHGGIKWFNYAFGANHNRYQDHGGHSPALGAGVDIGIRMPLGRNSKWSFEAGLGCGVYHLDYDIWQNNSSRELIDRKKKWGIFLDYLSLSAVYSLDVSGKRK